MSKDSDRLPVLCGSGCACGTTVKTGKWKIAIMVIVMAAIAIALIYKEVI